MSALKGLTLSTFLGASLLIGGPAALAADEPEAVTVVVDNHSYFDMHVYVVPESGIRRSLGMATGLTKRSFVLPRTLVDQLVQVVALPIGSRASYATDPFYLSEGEQLNVTLENNLRLSWTTQSGRPEVEKAVVGR